MPRAGGTAAGFVACQGSAGWATALSRAEHGHVLQPRANWCGGKDGFGAVLLHQGQGERLRALCPLPKSISFSHTSSSLPGGQSISGHCGGRGFGFAESQHHGGIEALDSALNLVSMVNITSSLPVLSCCLLPPRVFQVSLTVRPSVPGQTDPSRAALVLQALSLFPGIRERNGAGMR